MKSKLPSIEVEGGLFSMQRQHDWAWWMCCGRRFCLTGVSLALRLFSGVSFPGGTVYFSLSLTVVRNYHASRARHAVGPQPQRCRSLPVLVAPR